MPTCLLLRVCGRTRICPRALTLFRVTHLVKIAIHVGVLHAAPVFFVTMHVHYHNRLFLMLLPTFAACFH